MSSEKKGKKKHKSKKRASRAAKDTTTLAKSDELSTVTAEVCAPTTLLECQPSTSTSYKYLAAGFVAPGCDMLRAQSEEHVPTVYESDTPFNPTLSACPPGDGGSISQSLRASKRPRNEEDGSTELAPLKRAREEHDYEGRPSHFGEEVEDPVSELHEEDKYSERYSGAAQRIMASMGYKAGEGLGRSGGGIVNPIEESMHKGRRGLGFVLEGLEKRDVHWEEEEVSYEIQPVWLDSCTLPPPTVEEMQDWMQIRDKKLTIEDETLFCDSEILHKILCAKSVFDNLQEKEFLDARQRSNPFETIKGAIFQNRAAMKMANIDAEFDFMFSRPRNEDGTELVASSDVLYFADICAGPGGFSEYILWRKTWHAKGFGFTLKDPDSASDFKLDSFHAAPCETFDPHYGVGGYDGDGDITRPDNLEAFSEYVLAQTDGSGVHFVMADGGISVEGQENIQEILTKQLVLCQYACALSILMEGGKFVCKVFDMYTPFSVGLFYLLYRCFARTCIYKPVTSRPANSERYIVCCDLLPGSEVVTEYLLWINTELCRLKDSHQDVLDVVPFSVMTEDESFASHIRAFNDSFGINQHVHLNKLQYFIQNTNLQEPRQSHFRSMCLARWKVPLTPRTVPSMENVMTIFDQLWKDLACGKPASILNSGKFTSVNMDNLEFLRDVHSWRWTWACGKRLLIIGLGGNRVQGWAMKSDEPVFTSMSELSKVELPKKTMLEVEVVEELTREGSGQKKQITLYILDVIAVYGKLLANKPLKERSMIAAKLCQVLNKPCRRGTILFKTKEVYRVVDMQQYCDKLALRRCKGHPSPIPTFNVTDETFIAPMGMMFFRIVKAPWQLQHSRRAGKLYFFNTSTGTNTFDCPPSSVSTYINSLESRHLWLWSRAIFDDLCGLAAVPEKECTEVTRTLLCRTISDFEIKPKAGSR